MKVKRLLNIIMAAVAMLALWATNPAIASASTNIQCQGADIVTTQSKCGLFIALANTNTSDVNVQFNILDNTTVASGLLEKGKTTSVIIAASDNPNILQIQNTTQCDSSGLTPYLTFDTVDQC